MELPTQEQVQVAQRENTAWVLHNSDLLDFFRALCPCNVYNEVEVTPSQGEQDEYKMNKTPSQPSLQALPVSHHANTHDVSPLCSATSCGQIQSQQKGMIFVFVAGGAPAAVGFHA